MRSWVDVPCALRCCSEPFPERALSVAPASRFVPFSAPILPFMYNPHARRTRPSSFAQDALANQDIRETNGARFGSITLGDISCRPRPLVTIIPPPYCWLCRFFIITAARMDKKDTRWFPLNLVSLGVRYVMIITGASLWGHPPVIADQRVCVRGEIDCLLWFFGPPFEAVLTSISSTGACALE